MLESFKGFRDRPDYSTGWPDSFDFETDVICQTIFKPFIEEQLAELKAYDAERPDDITYIFHEHALRVAINLEKTCRYIGLSGKIARNMYWALLLHDIGKKDLPVDIWDTEEKPDGELKAQRRTHTVIGAQLIEEHFCEINHPFKTLITDIMLHHHEQMNGSGTWGFTEKDLSHPVRLSAIIEAYDGWRIWRPHYEDRDISIPGVLTKMREQKGPDFFDMELFESFSEMKMTEYETEYKLGKNQN